MPTLNQPSMSGGEVTPEVWGRVDMDLYRIGLAKAQNFMVNYHGGIQNRPGFRLVGQARSNGSVVLIPFQFSTIQTYMLEFSDRKIRIIKDGGFVVKGNGAFTPQTAASAIYEIDSPYLEGELDRITFTQSADVLTIFHRNHPITNLKRFDHDDWRIEVFDNKLGPFETLNSNESLSMWASGQQGAVDLHTNFNAFGQQHVGTLITLEQQTSGQVTTWIQRMSTNVGDKCYYNGKYYQCTQATRKGDNPAQTGDTPPTHTEGEEWDGPNQVLPDDNRDAYIGVKWKYLHQGYGMVRIDSVTSAQLAKGTVVITIPETIVGGTSPAQDWEFKGQTTQREYILTPSPTTEFISDMGVVLVGAAQPDQPLSYPDEWVMDFASSTMKLLVDPGYKPASGALEPRDVQISQKGAVRTTYKWAFEPWRSDNKYPQCGTYYQGRFCNASTQKLPQTLWMSQTDSFNSFVTSRPILADDSMRFDVNSLQVNEILHMLPLNALLLFTSGGVWSINQGSNDVVTPENPPNVRIQSYDGASPLRPIVTGSSGLYVQDGQQIIRDIGFDFSSDAYIGIDLTVRATHLFEKRKIVSWCYAKNPHKMIVCVFDDGEFAMLTYMKEQQVWGWCSGNTDGHVKWCASIREGVEDAVYLVVERNGVNYIERAMERANLTTADQFFVDSGLTYDGRNHAGVGITLTATDWDYPEEVDLVSDANLFDTHGQGAYFIFDTDTQKAGVEIQSVTSPTQAKGMIMNVIPEEMRGVKTTKWGVAQERVSGLNHLEGREVSILGDGAVIARQTVSGGIIDLGGYFVVVHAGLPYTSIMQTLDLELAQPPETVRAKKKLVTKVRAMVRNTASFKAGVSLDRLEDTGFREDENYGFAPDQKTKIVDIAVDGYWSDRGRIMIVQEDPIATEILSLLPEITISER